MKILITGISGKVGRVLAKSLLSHGHQLVGIDKRRWPDAPPKIKIHQCDVRKRAAEDVFRKAKPEVVIHMATVTHLRTRRTKERFRINLGGTRAVFKYCEKFGAKHCIFVGRHTYYGAAADSPMYHSEDEPPMAVTTFPELADLVAADLYAGSAIWRIPKLTTTVLRMVYTLGPTHAGTLAGFLKGPRVPTVLGFDPLFQFLHEEDIASAIEATITNKIEGVFNVSGPAPVPLSVVIRETGRTAVPIPEFIFSKISGRFGFPKLPPGALSHVKFPVTIDSSVFRDLTGWEASFDEVQCMESFRWSQ